MNRASYLKQLEADLARWSAKGWIGADGLAQIRAEIGQAPSGWSRLPALFAGIGTICLALAVAAFVAANWEVIPRPVKLTGIAVLLLAAHGFAAAMASRGQRLVADLATMFATLVFVSGLALVGQIYHLPSDWAGGALLVAIGALAAAWLCGSRSSLMVAAVASIAWLLWIGDPPRPTLAEVVTALALLAACLGHVVRMTSFAGRWLVLLLLTAVYAWLFAAWLDINYLLSSSEMEFSILLVGAAFGALLLVWGHLLSGDEAQGDDGSGDVSALARSAASFGVMVLVGIVLLTLIIGFTETVSDEVAREMPHVWPLHLTLAAMLAGLVLQALRAPASRPLRIVAAAVVLSVACPALLVFLPGNTVVLASFTLAALVAISAAGSTASQSGWSFWGNLGLAAALLYLLYETVGSLLGQSVFFFVAGLLLVAVAIVSARRLRKSSAAAAGEGAQ
ncbi:DUF2157 domain-containing protein [Stappia sp. 28M-7]|uniref:DUF2157 domain-containing protein n=1 Tax=Stappia sp. 28M-7 TaxID=2762596 RepID=UPI00163CE4CF|nr:DUF2157 domain-containing protein [Stappia sp. 28M-7]MBC2858684.1 DUF2157 domain-containing protein [Stappia sp. 28M-7]